MTRIEKFVTRPWHGSVGSCYASPVEHRIRAARPSDRPFIAKSLRGCLRETSVGRHADEPHMTAEVNALLDAWAAEGALSLVACDVEDEGVLLGFGVAQAPTLHALYVRRDFRHLGLGRSLLAELGYCSRYTLPPPRGARLLARMTYAPRLVLRGAA